MQSTELINFVNLFPSISCHFLGVFSFTAIPINIKTNDFLIINTDAENLPGKHWFCLIKRTKFFEYFDSLGVDINKLELLKNRLNFKKTLNFKFNTTQLQKETTSSCGPFVLYFLIQRYHNFDLSFYDILNEIFFADLDKNEEKVANFITFFQK